MKYGGRLAFEVVAVAAATALSMGLAVAVAGPIASVKKALVVGLLVGAIIHVAFEVLGGNAWYCSYGAACLR